MAIPAFQPDDDPPEKTHRQDHNEMMSHETALYLPKPGVSGIHPLTLLVTMMVGAMMWVGIFYLGHILLQALF